MDPSNAATIVAPDEAIFHAKLKPLFGEHRNTVLYGGRGGLKSWGAADAALIQGSQRFERVLCCRETMDSIAESMHYLLEKRIYDLGLQQYYKVLQYTIIGPEFKQGRTEFIFAGLRHNVRKIKSLEGATLVIVEEAEAVSKDSWDTLLPTIRWEDPAVGRKSRVWVIFNPKLPTDETYKRWVLNPPPDTVVVNTNYRDAQQLGIFPEVLRIQMEHTKKTDPDGYSHVWEGECVQALKGAIYAGEYKKAQAEGRIGSVPHDPGRPVDTFWDLGYGDKMAIWFGQQVGGWWHFVDYIENSGEPLSWYVIQMQRRQYIYRTCYLPHDGVDAMLHGKTLANDRTKSPDMVLRGLGYQVRIAPKLEISTGVDAVRTIFPRCRFDEEKCREGLSALQHYQWGEPAATGQERSKPLHNWASHGADALRTFGVSAKPEEIEEPQPYHSRPSRGGLKMPW